jgi:hypothetical protein
MILVSQSGFRRASGDYFELVIVLKKSCGGVELLRASGIKWQLSSVRRSAVRGSISLEHNGSPIGYREPLVSRNC